MQPERVRWVDRNRPAALTASSFGCAVGLKGKVYHFVDYLRNFADTKDRFQGNPATFHGQRTEDVSKMVYERLVNGNTIVEDGGFFICPEHPRQLAATPDGIVSWRPRPPEESGRILTKDDTNGFLDSSEPGRVPYRLLEIKSPVMSLYDCCREENTKHGIPKAYMCQMQGQLFFSGAVECDFFVFVARSPPEVACWRVYRSQSFYDWMVPKLLQVTDWVAAPKGTPTHELLPIDFKWDSFDFDSVRVEPVVIPSRIAQNAPIRDQRRFAWFFRQTQHLRFGNGNAVYGAKSNQLIDPEQLDAVLPQPESMADPFLQLIATQQLREGDWVLWQKGATADVKDPAAAAAAAAGATGESKSRSRGRQVSQDANNNDNDEDDDENSKNKQEDDSSDQLPNPTQLSLGSQQLPRNTGAALSQQPTAPTSLQQKPAAAAATGGIPQRSPSVQLTPSRCQCCGFQAPGRIAPPSVATARTTNNNNININDLENQTPMVLFPQHQQTDGAAAAATASSLPVLAVKAQQDLKEDSEFSRLPRIARVLRLHADSGLVEMEVLQQRPVVAVARAMARTVGGGGGGWPSNSPLAMNSGASSSSSSGSISSFPTSPFFSSSGSTMPKMSTSAFLLHDNAAAASNQTQHKKKKVAHFTPSLGILPQVMRCRVCGGEDERKQHQQDSGQQQQDGAASIAEQQEVMIRRRREEAQQQQRQQFARGVDERFALFGGCDCKDATSTLFGDPATDSFAIVRRRGRPVYDEEKFWFQSNINSLSWRSIRRLTQQQLEEEKELKRKEDEEKLRREGGKKNNTNNSDDIFLDVGDDDNDDEKGGDGSSKKIDAATADCDNKISTKTSASSSRPRFYNALSCELVQQLWHNPMVALLRTPSCSSVSCLVESLKQLRLIIGGEMVRVPPKSAAALWHVASLLCSPLVAASFQQQSQSQKQLLRMQQSQTATAADNSQTQQQQQQQHQRAMAPMLRGWVTDSFQLGTVCHRMLLRSVQAAGSTKQFALSNEICAVMTMSVFNSLLESGAAGRRRAAPLMPMPPAVVLRHIFRSPQYEEDPEAYMQAMGEGNSIGAWENLNNACFDINTGSNSEFLRKVGEKASEKVKQNSQQKQPQQQQGITSSNIQPSTPVASSALTNVTPNSAAPKRTKFSAVLAQRNSQQQSQSQGPHQEESQINNNNSLSAQGGGSSGALLPLNLPTHGSFSSSSSSSSALPAVVVQQQKKKPHATPFHAVKQNTNPQQSPVPVPSSVVTASAAAQHPPPPPPPQTKQPSPPPPEQQPHVSTPDVWKSPVWIVCSEEENSLALPDVYRAAYAAADRDEEAPWIWYVN